MSTVFETNYQRYDVLEVRYYQKNYSKLTHELTEQQKGETSR